MIRWSRALAGGALLGFAVLTACSDSTSDDNSGTGGGTPGANQGQTPGSTAGATGATAGSSAGSTAGSSAGSTAGSTSGSTAGSTSGSTSGSTAGSTAGSTSGSTAGTTSGDTAGTTSGTTAGTTSGDTAGTTSGTTTGTTGNDTDASIPQPVTCDVEFVVKKAFVSDAGSEAVYLVGGHSSLGFWEPNNAVLLTASTVESGTWSGKVRLLDDTRIEFKFIKRSPSGVVWEDWGFRSNRAFRVVCAASLPDGGTPDGSVDGGVLVDASTDASLDASLDASKDAADGDATALTTLRALAAAEGRLYEGVFNQKPADATPGE